MAAFFVVSSLLGAGGLAARIATDLSAVLLLASGYGLIMFRDSFITLGSAGRRLVTVVTVAAAIVAIAAQLPADPGTFGSPFQVAVLTSVTAVWAACVLEPVATFWLASRSRPAVEQARLRALSLGYLGLFAVIVIGTIAGSASSQALTLAIRIGALAVVPLLYVAFFPAGWLRRIWRQSEEDQFRHALHDLLLYSPDRVTLAKRALGWSARLVGGDAAFVVDSDALVLAARGISDEDARQLTKTNGFAATRDNGGRPWRDGPMVVLPLEMQSGRGAMIIMSDRLTPLFGDDEMNRLREYASSISAGLDRVTMTNRIRVLEQAKSEFLNVASHELRGPMTVIKGYLTMLDGGALGEIPSRAQSVLPLLISKSDEVNWMLERMVEASRLEEGRLALKKRRVDLVELVGSAVDGVKMLTSGHEVLVGRPARAIVGEVDPDRFQMVIRNLLSNAAKYSPSGTEIAVRISRDEQGCTVAVTDHGAGISPEDQAGLFTRFSRVGSTLHVAGTGLGLWLSREIARMHDGDVTVDSHVGRGSTFSFTVPLRPSLA